MAEPPTEEALYDRAGSSLVDDWRPPEVFDEFRILRPLGEGAMGQVYLGLDTALMRQVAIKFMASGLPEEAAQRFLIEARAVARLHHPNVVSIFRVGQVAGRPYLVSEYVSGRSLDRRRLPLSFAEALPIARGLARGLAAAHQRGVLHRDIKPANVMLATDGEVKLVDFGLAKLTDDLTRSLSQVSRVSRPGLGGELDRARGRDGLGKGLTQVGALIGTPHYMAPEVLRGDGATARSDVYSLGALLYEVCSGQRPHPGETLRDIYVSVLSGQMRPLAGMAPGYPAGFCAIVDRCMRADPAGRYPSAGELRDALERLADQLETPRSRRRLVALAGAGVLALVLGLGWGHFRGGEAVPGG